MTEKWRLIDTGSCDAAYNMALDEAVAFHVRKESSPPTLRLYGWNVPSVSIGCFQKISALDTGYCTENTIPIVRRPTGGHAVLHDCEITYSFSVKTASGPFSRGLFDSYKKICSALGLALSKLGFSPELKLVREKQKSLFAENSPRNPLCFRSLSYGEISVDNTKVIGSAQKRWPDGLLQQGSIPLSLDRDAVTRIFRLPVQEASTSAGLYSMSHELTMDLVKENIRIAFEEIFAIDFVFASPAEEEARLACTLEAEKYLSPEWNFRR